jgi:hypothetical protein
VSVVMTLLYIAVTGWKMTVPWIAVLLAGFPAHAIWTRFAARDKMPAS